MPGSETRIQRANAAMTPVKATPNPSFQPTCSGLRPAHAAELTRWASPLPRGK